MPALVQLRAEADLRQGRQDEAVARLTKLINARQSDVDTEKSLLAFAQERSLDSIIEVILTRRIERDPSKPEPAFELATYYRTRDNTSRAVEVLRAYCANASLPADQARRMNDSAQFLATGGALEEALKLQGEAAALVPGNRDSLMRLADFMADFAKRA